MTPTILRELADALEALGLVLAQSTADRSGIAAMAVDAQRRAVAACYSAAARTWTVAASDSGDELRGPELLPILRAEIAHRWTP